MPKLPLIAAELRGGRIRELVDAQVDGLRANRRHPNDACGHRIIYRTIASSS